MGIKVAINGFGRIGRCFLRRAMEYKDIEVVVINDLMATPETAAYLFKYDSVYRKYKGSVSYDNNSLIVDGKNITITRERDPEALPWKRLDIDVVVECTGRFTDKEAAERHLKAGAKKVIISAPSKNADAAVVLGVNEDVYNPEKHNIISLASCTTNSLAPVAKVLNDSFGIESLIITAIHAYTAGQALVDSFGKRLRRARAAAVSIIPTTTGATIATEQVLPELKGRMAGLAMRVPIICGSVTDIVATLRREATAEEINNTLRIYSKERMKGILEVTDDRIVSSDIIGNSHSAIVDAVSTMVLQKRVVKVLSWYDNEWAYACRLVDFTRLIGRLL